MRRSLVFGFWFLVLTLAVACAAGGDDDDSTEDAIDDDASDDDATDDDADDDAGPTPEQCDLIWTGCEDDFPIDPTDAGCGAEPEFVPEDWEKWADWEDCTFAALFADWSALDACGYDVGCDDATHGLYSCKASYYGSLGDCAVESQWPARQECIDEKSQDSLCYGVDA